MAAQQPQFNFDLPRHEQPGDFAEEPEPDAALAQPSMEWGDVPARPTLEDYQRQGDEAYARAIELERLFGLEDPHTIEAYRQASTNLISVSAETKSVDGTWWGPKPLPDPVRLLKIGTSLAKQAAAPIVEPYSQIYFDGRGEPIDRRANLSRLSKETLKRASDIIFGAEGNAEWEARFDAAFEPVDALASAAVEAAALTGTSGHAAVDQATIEQLRSEGQPAVSAFIERNASHARGVEFLGEMGKIAVTEMDTQGYQLPAAI